MRTRSALALCAVVGLGAALTWLVVDSLTAGATPLCGGNQTIQTAPVDCTNSKTFTFGALSRTVTIVLHVPAGGSGSTVTFTLDKTVPQSFPIRVRSHAGVSSTPGPLVDDVQGTFPANSLGPVVLTFRVDCGQIDVKAVFTAPGDERGRIAGPYVCTTPQPVTETTTTSVPVTQPPPPGSTTPETPTPASSTVPPAVAPTGTLPATGATPPLNVALVLLAGGVVLVALAVLGRGRNDVKREWFINEVIEELSRRPDLLVVAKPKCRCDDGPTPDELAAYWSPLPVPPAVGCPDCGGTGYVPMVALPAKVVDVAQALAAEAADLVETWDRDLHLDNYDVQHFAGLLVRCRELGL